MTTYDKYEEIRKMSMADRREIYQFALQRSREMLSGIDSSSNPLTKSGESQPAKKDNKAGSFQVR